jgi:hypothetical protein
MPKGPQGQKRKADVVGNAVLIGKIATGEIEEKLSPKRAKTAKKAAKARAESLTPEQRADIAKTAAQARWKKSR